MIFLPILYATIAAIGNALFALGQRKAAGVENGLLFVGFSALVAMSCALICAPLIGTVDVGLTVRVHWKAILGSGLGLFLTYLGFNLLYTRFGASQYALYAVISILTTTIGVGILWLREPVTIYHKLAIALALAAVVLFSIGQSKL
jgi:drug/metabolite transporter (DMT)-like permease